jgi:transposase
MCATTARFAGPDPPAPVFLYSPDGGGEHPEQHLAGYVGLMQTDADEAVRRIDLLFAIEREINGLAPQGASARAPGA